jgi:hypothetical protein
LNQCICLPSGWYKLQHARPRAKRPVLKKVQLFHSDKYGAAICLPRYKKSRILDSK